MRSITVPIAGQTVSDIEQKALAVGTAYFNAEPDEIYIEDFDAHPVETAEEFGGEFEVLRWEARVRMWRRVKEEEAVKEDTKPYPQPRRMIGRRIYDVYNPPSARDSID